MKEIYLSNGDVARVDDADYQRLSQFKWSQHPGGAVRYARNKTYLMHREILDATKGAHVRHLDGDKLNNCQSNLEVMVRQDKPRENPSFSNSKSGLLGVSWVERLNKWRAQFNHNYERQDGYFDCPVEAANFYDSMARKFLGDNARTNAIIELTTAQRDRLEAVSGRPLPEYRCAA